jgi:hypothetical protein
MTNDGLGAAAVGLVLAVDFGARDGPAISHRPAGGAKISARPRRRHRQSVMSAPDFSRAAPCSGIQGVGFSV